MAALYGRMKDQVTSGRREVTRMAHQEIASTLETWDGAVKTELERDGSFRVYIGSKYNPDTLIAKGNINDGKREVMCPDYRGSTEGTHESISTLYEFTRHDMASPLGL